LVVGDFNIYYSDEPAFHQLTDSLANNNGRLCDPLDAWGVWHENSDFAYTHTQSSRVEQLPDGGAGGGLDDRFDMILCSGNLLDSEGLYMLRETYTTCGNDGNHFNMAVHEGYNQVVPADVADALYFASDHLPVYVTVTSEFGHGASSEELVKILPNPMETEAQICFPELEDFDHAKIMVTNILGQRVYDAETYNTTGHTLMRSTLAVGIYFVHVEITTKYETYRYHTKLAVVR
jgi:hypothetical protein